MNTVFCPDCEHDIPANDFVSHREAEHPPAPMAISVEGVRSNAAMGYAPPDPED